jgi:L-threonylcarbamoyladenylate synthase
MAMKSTIIKHPLLEENLIKKAIENHDLIVFPTETVYGLGASIYDEIAVKKIFTTKGRPQDNPLIIHIADLSQLDLLVTEVNAYAKKLINAFWPGPLTLVLPKSKAVPNLITANLLTVAVRMPKDSLAREVIKAAGVPLCAPSANLSGKPSGTTFEAVYRDFFGKVAVFVDGGIPEYGIESTVIDLTAKIPTILRPGAVSVEAIENILGMVVISSSKVDKAPKSPGMKYQHYKPFGDVVILDGSAEEIFKLLKKTHDPEAVFMGSNEVCGQLQSLTMNTFALGPQSTLETIARALYRTLRTLDDLKVKTIYTHTFSTKGIGSALMNRLEKASSKTIKL